MKVLGLSGSLRADSHNSRLLRAAAELLPPGAELIVFDGLKAIPPYDQDDEPAGHQAVDALRAAIVDADAVLVATPEYNHSLPGHFKNALDWVSRPITNRRAQRIDGLVPGGLVVLVVRRDRLQPVEDD